ncbi:MAG: hypothetical protein EXR51_02050 [Dehalococcoidia bacterium]|nr:hypothetical protein [Dehalococcoidia bacterium]
MDIHWKKLNKFKTTAGNAARIFAAAALLVMAAGPLPATPRAVEAKDMEWSDARLPLTSEADTDDTNGFQRLPDMGNEAHHLVVAPNGDLFVAGKGEDSPTITGQAAGNNFDGSGQPAIYRSTDGGAKWRGIAMPTGVSATAVIQQVVVSPDYPSDGFVGVVIGGGANNSTGNGFCWSINQGLTWSEGQCKTGAAATSWNAVLWRTAALSPNFNYNDGSGTLALGGVYVATAVTTVTIAANALLSATVDPIVVAIVEGTAPNSAHDNTLSLAYTFSEEPSSLARLYTTDVGHTAGAVGTYAQIKGDAGWPALAAAAEIKDAASGAAAVMNATMGAVAFDDVYTAGGSFFAAVGNATVGGVFKFDGTWLEKTGTGNADCNGPTDSLSVSGNGSNARLLSSLRNSNKVCRSTNEGGSFSDNDVDNAATGCDLCEIAKTSSETRVASNRSSNTVYWTTSGARGGVSKSTNGGSSWADTGLTNNPYVFGGPLETSESQSFSMGAVNSAQALWMTNNSGSGASWTQVLRFDGTDLTLPSSFPGDWATAGTAYIHRTLSTVDPVLKTTDGGRTWDKTSADPFANGPETTELIKTASSRSALAHVFGGDKGHVSITEDGGVSWRVLAKDFGGQIDEFDFIGSGVAMFIVTAMGDDTIMRLWLTSDSGVTFTEIGNGALAWGGGTTADFTTLTGTFDGTKGVLLVGTNGASNDDLWRFDAGAATPVWVDGGTDTKWKTLTLTKTPGVGDGQELFMLTSAGVLWRTNYPFSTTSGDWAEQKLTTQAPPLMGGAMGTTITAAGTYSLQITYGGRVQEYTFTKAFQDGVSVTSPMDGGSVASNIGDNGIPAIFRWNSTAKAACYDVQISLEPTFDSPALDNTAVAGACPANTNGVTTGATLQVTSTIFGLVQGQTYYWRARVRSTDASLAATVTHQGPWTKGASFAVSSVSNQVTAPQPSLPLSGSMLPGAGTSLSWNNPAGATQVHVQVTPLNGDGPAINLILNAVSSYDVPAPVFGTGPYVMLPGASYTWRLRVSNSTSAIGEGDASWGQWSDPRVFTTALPNAGTIQLVAPINGAAITDTTPTLMWKDGNSSMFYYEIQLSSDKNFGEAGAIAPVFTNLIHGGVAKPENTWTVPEASALPKGTYFWRLRQRVQATPKGGTETGIAWSPAQSFVVQ